MKLQFAHLISIPLLLVIVASTLGGSQQTKHDCYIYDKAVNETLDVVMFMQDEVNSQHLKLNWDQFNTEVCRRMNVKRTHPWQRK